MGFFSRLFNIGKSQVNSVLDKMEDPAKMIDVQIDNARKSVSDYQKEVAAVMADHRLAQKRLMDSEKEKQQWLKAAEKWASEDEAKAVDCIEKAEKLGHEVTENRRLVEQQAKAEEEMRANLDSVKQKLKEAESARTQVKAAAKRAEAKEKTAKILSKNSFDESAFGALEKLKSKAIEMEAKADATLELNGQDMASVSDEKDLLTGPKTGGLSLQDRILALSDQKKALPDSSNSSLESRINSLKAPETGAKD